MEPKLVPDYHIVKNGLEFVIHLPLSPSAGMIGMCHNAWFIWFGGDGILGLTYAKQAPTELEPQTPGFNSKVIIKFPQEHHSSTTCVSRLPSYLV